MEQLQGKSVYQGIAIGRIFLWKHDEKKITDHKIQDGQMEWERYEQARIQAGEQLQQLYDKALEEAGEEQATIFQVHQMMLEDLDYHDSVNDLIVNEFYNAEYAVQKTGEVMSEIFKSMDDEYMQARSADILDISDRVIQNLMGTAETVIDSEEPIILLAEDLTPSETVQMDKSKILAFVTRKGSSNSHTAILARSMNLPSLVKTETGNLEKYAGKLAIVDGFHGTFIVEPAEDVLQEMTARRDAYLAEVKQLQNLIGQPNMTRDGRSILLYANIGSEKDLGKVLENDAGGIGLFRSEFLYLGRDTYPSEEEQFRKYKEVIAGMQGKRVVIRTMDIGADKKVDYFELDAEENPALGYRAIRICLDRLALFKTQLRAIYRASAYGKTAIMFPMIISVSEIVRIKEIVAEVKAELTKENQPFGEVELGVMIETPAAALISDKLAKEVDFFSIGTNDLTQYTLAIDRQNQNLEQYYDSHHEAVLQLIRMTVENGHKAGIWVGICGELAADDSLTEWFLDIGMDELSVSASYILKIRRKIREI